MEELDTLVEEIKRARGALKAAQRAWIENKALADRLYDEQTEAQSKLDDLQTKWSNTFNGL